MQYRLSFCLLCFDSMKVMFYVKDKLLKAKDGYEVAAILKEKIGNEEGFFEFRMLKVEPYSKYSNVRSPDDDDDDDDDDYHDYDYFYYNYYSFCYYYYYYYYYYCYHHYYNYYYHY